MVLEAHGETLSSNDGPRSQKKGYEITIGASDLTLTAVYKHNLSQATTAYLEQEDGTVIASATFSGDTATFSSPQTLTALAVYRIECDKGGASYTGRNDGGGTSFPIAGTYLTFSNGSFSSVDNTSIYDSTGIEVEVVVPPAPDTSTASNAGTIGTAILRTDYIDKAYMGPDGVAVEVSG